MKLATCNEPWRDTPVEEVFQIAARIGFDGVEVAPFTIADHVDDVSADRRKRIVKAAADAGVAMTGLHWLFVSPKGLHLTTPDDAVRQKTADYLEALVHFCGDLGGTVMTLGSPNQRNIEPPNIDIMLDIKAMGSMPDGIVETIRRFGGRARHVHANHPSGKGVGMPLAEGDGEPLDVNAILKALVQTGFDRWVSLEPFDYKPDPATVAQVGLKTLKAAMPA